MHEKCIHVIITYGNRIGSLCAVWELRLCSNTRPMTVAMLETIFGKRQYAPPPLRDSQLFLLTQQS